MFFTTTIRDRSQGKEATDGSKNTGRTHVLKNLHPSLQVLDTLIENIIDLYRKIAFNQYAFYF